MIGTGLAVAVTVLTLLVVTALGLWASRGRALTGETLVSAPGELGSPVSHVSPVLFAALVWGSLGAVVLLFGYLLYAVGRAGGVRLVEDYGP